MKSFRILMIGNSFSICAGDCLPDLVRSAGHGIRLASAYIGGCSLEHHLNCLERADYEPAYRPYDYSVWSVQAGQIVKQSCPGNLPEMLRDDVWDVVTIQQASHFSWDPSTYQPFADRLVERVRRDQPRAKLMIQQTWAYRAWDPRFHAAWPFGPEDMDERVSAAYRDLAARYGTALIPTGAAVRIARTKSPRKLAPLDRTSLSAYAWPDLPPQAGDVVGAMGWRRNAGGELELWEDNIHLNLRGQYLQGCVWLGAVYGVDPRTVGWVRDGIADSDALFLRQCAYEALAENDPSFPSQLISSKKGY